VDPGPDDPACGGADSHRRRPGLVRGGDVRPGWPGLALAPALARGRPEDARTLLDEGLDLSLAADSTQLVTLCLAAFARLAFVEGNPERAALLAGAFEGLRRRVGLWVWPSHRRAEAELGAQLRQTLGTARFDQVSAAGARLARREAVATVHDAAGHRPAP
jgi:hypothetical protein